tara:strand:- start:29 stop:793 length:765 start_codon:yes stop_codon:yes gene_type:complete
MDNNDSIDFFQLNLTGSSKAGDQIEDWISPGTKKINKLFKLWDEKSPLELPEIEEGGEISKFHKILDKDEIPEVLPEIGDMQLYKSAKPTDFITGSFLEQYGLIISKQAMEILETFNLGEFKCFPLGIIHKKKTYNNYFFIKFHFNYSPFINYKESEFFVQTEMVDPNSKVKIDLNSQEEVSNKNKELIKKFNIVRSSLIYLNSNFPQIDLFKLRKFGQHKLIISKHLAEALKGLSGIEITPVTTIKKLTITQG